MQQVAARSDVARWRREGDGVVRVAVFALHRLEADALASVLHEARLTVTAVVDDLDALTEAVTTQAPDVVLLDAPLQVAVGAAARLRRAGRPRVPVVVVPATADAEGTARLAAAGIDGVVDRCSPATTIVMALRQVTAGCTVYPMRTAVATRLRTAGALTALSPRQRDVLRLVAAGYSNGEIARELFISVNTVKFHLRCIFRELGLRNRVEAAQRYAELEALGD